MFNWVHVLTSKLYFTKPSVQYIQPKTLNLFFKNSLNPQLVLLNLNKFSSVKTEINQNKEESSNTFSLDLVILTESLESKTISVAKFETRKEAEKAQHVLKAKLFGVEKSMIKVMLVLLMIVFFFGLMSDFVKLSLRNTTQAADLPQISQQAPQGMSSAQMETMLKQYQEQQQAQQPVQQSQPVPEEQTSQNPAVQDFLKDLK